MLADLQINEFVGDNAHLLQRESLDTSSGETLNDPTLRLLLEAFDFSLDELDHNIVIHCEIQTS